MKSFELKAGVNCIDNGYGHICRVGSGRIVCIEVYSQSPGTVTVKQKVGSIDNNAVLATIAVGSDGYGVSQTISKFFAYGDRIVLSGDPVEGGNKYIVRCFYE